MDPVETEEEPESAAAEITGAGDASDPLAGDAKMDDESSESESIKNIRTEIEHLGREAGNESKEWQGKSVSHY